uniref:Uncharacterized protein n=1 Tax=Arundo donax TaxID=35708 RepID=A0A0A9C4K7_ARUDO
MSREKKRCTDLITSESNDVLHIVFHSYFESRYYSYKQLPNDFCLHLC